MRELTVRVRGRELLVRLDGNGWSVDGEPVSTSLEGARGAPVRRLVSLGHGGHGGQSREITVERTEPGWRLGLAGEYLNFEVEGQRERLLRKFGARSGNTGRGGAVKAPMPGLVLRVTVREGDQVTPETGLLVLEAMKMENEIRAGTSGRVRAVRVSPGTAVEKGVLLVEIDPEP